MSHLDCWQKGRNRKKLLTTEKKCCKLLESGITGSAVERQALVAQLVEQRTENPRVTGSIPVQGMELLNIFSCGCSSVVEHQPSKLDIRVRFSPPAFYF